MTIEAEKKSGLIGIISDEDDSDTSDYTYDEENIDHIEIRSLKKKLNKTLFVKNKALTTIYEIEKENERLQKKVEDLERANAKLQGELKIISVLKEDEIQNIRTSCNELYQKYEELRTVYQNLQSEFITLKRRYNGLKSDYVMLISEYEYNKMM